jgi:phenylpropionate dioxygenase-like ring-hydroxylating dioxygenase large terminal subunit
MKPSHFYFSDTIFQKEQGLFNQAGYLGHEIHLQTNNYYCPPHDPGKVLVNNKNGIECLSNVCRHRQATIMNRSGNCANLVCPLHGWTYDMEGKLIGAPHFDQQDRHLDKFNTQTWNGLIFEKKGKDIVSDLSRMQLGKYFDFTGYAFHSKVEHICNYNWKTFIEVYLDDYHVDPFHPGLGNFVDCNSLLWEHGPSYSVQAVGIKNKLQTPGTATYKKWHKALLDYTKGKVPEHGAIWLTIYPNIMVEWYPEVLVISTLWPESPEKTRNIVEFYYPEEIVHFESEFVECHQAAYMETCDEDDEIAERMDLGRKQLHKRQASDYGPVHNPMEIGLNYFYDYYNSYQNINFINYKPE